MQFSVIWLRRLHCRQNIDGPGLRFWLDSLQFWRTRLPIRLPKLWPIAVAWFIIAPSPFGTRNSRFVYSSFRIPINSCDPIFFLGLPSVSPFLPLTYGSVNWSHSLGSEEDIMTLKN